MSSTDTTIRVPAALRDRIRHAAARRGMTQAEVMELALRELEQAEFLQSVAAVEWDAETRAEAQVWDSANLGESSDSWDPTP